MKLNPENFRVGFLVYIYLPCSQLLAIPPCVFYPLLPQSYRQLGQGTCGHKGRRHFQLLVPDPPTQLSRIPAAALSSPIPLTGSQGTELKREPSYS